MLKVLAYVLLVAQAFEEDYQPIKTFKHTVSALGHADMFFILPMCLRCRLVLPYDTPKDQDCPTCSTALFQSRAIIDEEEMRGNASSIVMEPILKYPFSSILHQLTEILSQEGIEDLMDAWRYRTDRHPDVLSDIMDGRVWKTLKAHDGTLFLTLAQIERPKTSSVLD